MVKIEIEMPKSCWDCPFCEENEENCNYCSITRIIFEEDYDFKKKI